MSLSGGITIDNRYELVGELASGGFAIVYKAWQKQFDRFVAIKVLEQDILAEADSLPRFEREAKTMSTLRHRNIVQVYGHGVWNRSPYMVMEFVEGKPLQALCCSGRRLDVRHAATLMKQVCEGMSCAHANGVVHRDLKPSNIMIVEGPDGKEVVKIIDFGLARMLPGFGIPAQKLTETGFALGTVSYMAPEQCIGTNVDHRVDIYSAGCILFECIAGREPFSGDETLGVMYQHIEQPPPKLVDILGPSKELEAAQLVIEKAMAKHPDQRYQTAEELQADVSALISGGAPSARKLDAVHLTGGRHRQQQSHTRTLLLSVIGGAVFVGGTIALLPNFHKPPAPTDVEPSSVELMTQLNTLIPYRRTQGDRRYMNALKKILKQNEGDHLLSPEKICYLERELTQEYILDGNWRLAFFMQKEAAAEAKKYKDGADCWMDELALGQTLIRAGRTTEGEAVLRRVIDEVKQQRWPPCAAGHAHFDLAEYHIANGELALAKKDLDEAAALEEVTSGPEKGFTLNVLGDELHAETFQTRSMVNLLQGRPQEALKDAEKAKQTVSSAPESAAKVVCALMRSALAAKQFDIAASGASDASMLNYREGYGSADTCLLMLASYARKGDHGRAATLVDDLLQMKHYRRQSGPIFEIDRRLCIEALQAAKYEDLLDKLEEKFGKELDIRRPDKD